MIFDLIGTLIDEETFLEEVDVLDEKLLSKYGINVDRDKYNALKPKVLDEIEHLPVKLAIKPSIFYELCLKHLGVKVQERTLLKLSKEFDNMYVKSVELKKGVKRVLSELKMKYALALVSDTAFYRVNGILDRYSLRRFFDVIITPEQYGRKKGQAPFRMVMRKLGAKPEESIVVGDRLKSDVLPAEKLGMYYIKVGKVGPGEIYTWYSKNIAGIPTLIKSIERYSWDKTPSV